MLGNYKVICHKVFSESGLANKESAIENAKPIQIVLIPFGYSIVHCLFAQIGYS